MKTKDTSGNKPSRSRESLIAFDEQSRQDFVSGFHKRKVERRQEYITKRKLREKAEKQERRQAKLEMRRPAREAAVAAISHVEAVKAGRIIRTADDADTDNAQRSAVPKQTITSFDGTLTAAIVTTEPISFDDDLCDLDAMARQPKAGCAAAVRPRNHR